jgi:hypothetical protein
MLVVAVVLVVQVAPLSLLTATLVALAASMSPLAASEAKSTGVPRPVAVLVNQMTPPLVVW